MPVRHLPPHPNLRHLKQQAKDLLRAHAARTLAAAQVLREFHPRFSGAADEAIFAAQMKLSDMQLTIAREHGYPSWPRLKQRIEKPTNADRWDLPRHERIDNPVFRRGVDLMDAGDAVGLRSWLALHPTLVHQHVSFEGVNYFRNPTLLEFVAENPIRHGRLPKNIVAIAELIINAGADLAAIDETLGLVCSGCVARECGVQVPLINLLCQHGADASRAMLAAAGHGEFEAVQALMACGAALSLPVAAALGETDRFRSILPGSDAGERHLALAMASQFGRVDILRMLLDAGEDPNRYNPAGSHSHSTPLHQAALAGNDEVVRLLVERGARVDLRDILWKGTPADWAQHQGKTEIEAYLRGLEEAANPTP